MIVTFSQRAGCENAPHPGLQRALKTARSIFRLQPSVPRWLIVSSRQSTLALTAGTEMPQAKRSSHARKRASTASRNPDLTDPEAMVFQNAVLKRLNGLIFLLAESLQSPSV